MEVHMSNPSLEADVAAAKTYEELFVPALFGQWASREALIYSADFTDFCRF